MAITGTGTENDPYVVTTYDELVSKASESGKYVKIDNDINITEEYPDGDMPTLVVEAVIDGNSKTISNWYKTDSGYCISTSDSANTTSCIHDLDIGNIMALGSSTAFINRAENNNERPFFINCNLRGKTDKALTTASSARVTFKQCSININLGSAKPFGFHGCYFDSCYIIFTSTYSSNEFFDDYDGSIAKDSYFEMNLPNITNNISMYSKGFDNCAIDITSNSSFRIGGSSSNVSIVNSTHAPNATINANCVGIADSDWLDVEVLRAAGFNA